ncbi:DUF805 domain-containing protein [Thermomonas paludicola]|uniref:DUF805 domain-containing protein n=1 Tax=Thermomonas paludicola TaxID=2884874 RepID=UPI0030B813E9
MFCQKCGVENSNDSKFCSGCGKSLGATSVEVGVVSMDSGAVSQMTFGKAISTCFSKYADFNGRSARPEYWWFYLFTVLLSWGAILVDSTQILSLVINLAVLIPVLAAGSRRLHDTNHSGWWQLIAFTVIGLIPLIYWLASKGDDRENDYGNLV